MGLSDKRICQSVVHKRIAVNFKTCEIWLKDQPEKGESPMGSIEESMGEVFVADLPEVALYDELEQVVQLLTRLLESGNEKAVMQAMADIHYRLDFLFRKDPDEAWAKHRKGVELRERHHEVFGDTDDA